MPVIKSYQRQVAPRPMPSVRTEKGIDPGAFGMNEAKALGQTGKDISGVGDKIGDVFLNEKRRYDAQTAKDAYAQASDELRVYLHDPDKGVYSQKGKAAEGIFDKANDKVEEFANKYREKLVNSSQHAAFDALWSGLRESTLNNVVRHQATEFKNMESATTTAIVDGAIADAAANYTAPESIRQAVVAGETAIYDQASRDGWSLEMKQQALEQFRTKTHTGVIARMMVDSPEMAQAYYKLNQKQIDGRMRAGLEAQLKDQVNVRFAQDKADSLIAKYGDSGEAKALASARKNYSGAKEEQVLAQVKSRYQDINRLKRENDERRTDDLTNKIINAKSLTEALAVADVEDDGSNRLALRRIADALHNDKEKKKTTVSIANLAAQDEIMMAIDEGLESVSSRNRVLAKAAEMRLTPTQTKGVLSYFKQGGKIGELKRSQLDSVVKELTGGKDGLEKHTGMWDEVLKRLPSGAPITDEVLMKIAGRLLVKEDSWGFDDSYLEYVQGGRKGEFSADVPKEARAGLVSQLRRMGATINDKNLSKMYMMPKTGVERQRIERVLRKNKAPVTDDNIAAFWLKYGAL